MSASTAAPSGSVGVLVVGIGADGALTGPARGIVARAPVVVGGHRQLALLPEIPGQSRLPLPRPLREGLLSLIEEHAPQRLVVLASGDPLVSGIGSTLIRLLGEDRVVVLPAVSSVTLARAEMRWPAESHATVSVVGRDLSLVRRELAPGRRILVLSADEQTPRDLAKLLVEAGFGDSPASVLGDLGGPDHSSHSLSYAWMLADHREPFPRLNIVSIECVGPHLGGWTAGLPDEAYEHDGQLTKRDLRASALARLAPVPGQHLWDVGAGAGSVGIEWMRVHPACTATAIESDPERAARIARNASALGVPGLEVVQGRAPDALSGLRPPDAVFIGGGATRPGVLDACLETVRPGGRLVVHGVTLETEQVLAQAYKTYGGELTRIAVETAAPVGTFTGWTPARTVTQWSLVR